MFDVAIAGAGPAGIACAVALQRRAPGLRVVVFDRARFPRSKPCGGGLTGRAGQALDALGLVVDVPSEAAPRAQVVFGSVAQRLDLARPVRVIRREEFDASLVAQACALNIDVRQGEGVAGVIVDDAGARFTVAGESLRARVLVGADGAGSATRKIVRQSLPVERPIRLFRAELAVKTTVPRDTMLYDFSAMAEGLRGYVWVFPSPDGRVNVGLMHDPAQPRSGADLTRLLTRQLRRYGIDLPPGAARGWPAWGYRSDGPVSAPHLLLIGDAAGIDALTGEGIAVGLEGGLVAADHIADALARGDFRFAGYRRALRRATVGRELALDSWMARFVYRDWQRWLPLVLFDDDMLALYGQRVCGSLVLADHKPALLRILARHLWTARSRRQRLTAAVAGAGVG